jgi:hypothetical protein
VGEMDGAESTRYGDKKYYINTYIHTYIHTYIYTYIHTYIHTYRVGAVNSKERRHLDGLGVPADERMILKWILKQQK